MSDWLILSASRLASGDRSAFPPGSLFLELEPGLGGAWTNICDGLEVIRFGYPDGSRNRWFQPFGIGKGGNLLELAIRRIVYARTRHCLAVLDPRLAAVAHRAVEPYGAIVSVQIHDGGIQLAEFAKRLANAEAESR